MVNPKPVVDPAVDPNLAAHLLDLAYAEVPSLEYSLVKVGYSELRTSETFSVTAIVVAKPLLVIAEHRFGRSDDASVVQVFPLSRLVAMASSAGRVFALFDMARVDASWAGFQVEGPLVSLPMNTIAADLML